MFKVEWVFHPNLNLLMKQILILSFVFMSVSMFAQRKFDGGLKLAPLKTANKDSVVISGNLKILAKRPNGTDIYKFIYRDLLTDRIVESIITTDSVGNFKSIVSLRTLQQLQLVRMNKVGDKLFNGPIELFLYAKPGDDINLNYYLSADRKTRNASYKGSLSDLNSQYDDYMQRKGLSQMETLIDFSITDSVNSKNYRQYERYVEQQLTLGLAYNSRYFKSFKTDPLLKQLLDAEFKYIAANALLNGASNAEKSLDTLNRFFKLNNIKFNDSIAFSNYYYKMFLRNYYARYLGHALKANNEFKTRLSDMGNYLLEAHTEFDEDTRKLARQMSDTISPLTGSKKKLAIDELMIPYNDEYVASLRTKILYEKLKEINDPSIREIFMIRLLSEAMDNYGVGVIKPLIQAYTKDVRPGRYKENFLRIYNSQQRLVTNSKLSKSSIINNTNDIKSDLISLIKEKHKGKVIFIDVWATWCKPCLSAMPDSRLLREKLKGRNVVFVYLCTDSKGTVQWKNLIALNKIEGDNYFLTKLQAQELADQFDITSIPRYIIIDKDGNVKNGNSKGPGDLSVFKELALYL
jgi:thiol-disulfide isomerase/thioredoxin